MADSIRCPSCGSLVNYLKITGDGYAEYICKCPICGNEGKGKLLADDCSATAYPPYSPKDIYLIIKLMRLS